MSFLIYCMFLYFTIIKTKLMNLDQLKVTALDETELTEVFGGTDNDGNVDVVDLAALLTTWGPC